MSEKRSQKNEKTSAKKQKNKAAASVKKQAKNPVNTRKLRPLYAALVGVDPHSLTIPKRSRSRVHAKAAASAQTQRRAAGNPTQKIVPKTRENLAKKAATWYYKCAKT